MDEFSGWDWFAVAALLFMLWFTSSAVFCAVFQLFIAYEDLDDDE